MEYKIGIYRIEVKNEPGSEEALFDSYFSSYSNVVEEGSMVSTRIGIKVFQGKELLSNSLLIGNEGATGIHKTSQVIGEDKIVICCSSSVFSLSIPDLKLNWKIKSDSVACFEIFKIVGGFIVHGELDITRLSDDGKIVWSKSGGDIFMTYESEKDDFKIVDGLIYATDWENRKYVFDLDGNELEE